MATVFLANIQSASEDEFLSLETLKIDCPGITWSMKRGDIIEDVNTSGYRSSGVWFFDGEEIIGQNYSVDDYGTPPKSLAFPEFPVGYWDKDNLQVSDKYAPGETSKFYWHISDPGVPQHVICPPLKEIVKTVDDHHYITLGGINVLVSDENLWDNDRFDVCYIQPYKHINISVNISAMLY